MSSSNQQQMFDCIKHWQNSGLSQKAWCEENNVVYGVFHYWYRRFRNQHLDSKVDAKDRFVQLKAQDRSLGTPWCELALSSGHRLFFHHPVAAEFIRSLLD